jgi:MscS family membrane protein
MIFIHLICILEPQAKEEIDKLEVLYQHTWIAVCGVIILTSWFLIWIWRKCSKALIFKQNGWFNATLESISWPIQILFFCGGFVGSAFYILDQKEGIRGVFQVIISLIIIWIIINFSRKAEEIILQKQAQTIDRISLDLIVRIVRAALILCGVLLILPLFKISISGILAFGGVGTIVVGMAAKDMLANVFGGMIVTLDKPFRIGDWISSPEKEIEGYVEHLGWRMTKIRSLDKQPIYVPNSLFSTVVLQNRSRMSHRRIKNTINLRYQDADLIETILGEIRKFLYSHPHVDKDQLCVVRLEDLADDCVRVSLYLFTKKTSHADFAEFQEDIYLNIMRIVRKNGGDFAYPTRTLYIHQDSLKQVSTEKWALTGQQNLKGI